MSARGFLHPRAQNSRRRQRRVAEFFPFHSKRAMDVSKRECARVVQKARCDGTLAQKPCETCGRKAQAHHDDYAKPMEIHWLCRYHHRLRDAELREQWRAQLKAAALNGLPVARLKILSAKWKSPAKVDPVKLAALSFRNTPRHMLAKGCSHDLIRQATVAVAVAMDAERMTESALAGKVQSSRQCVNALFAAGIRTLKAVAVYADALGYDASVVLRKREVDSRVVA